MNRDILMIIPFGNKDNVIENVRNIYKLKNIKFMYFDELIKNFYFDYKVDSVIYVMNKYNVNYNIANIYLNNIYYCLNKNINNKKCKFLIDLKNDLELNGYLIYNNLFLNYLKNVDVIIYNFDYLDKFKLNIIESLKNITNIDVINPSYNSYNHVIYDCNCREDEIDFVANEIISLINNNVDINSIKLVVPKDYYFSLERIFNIYNIPIIFNDKSLYNVSLINELLSNLDDIYSYLNIIDDTSIKNKVIDLLNKYNNYNYCDIKDVLIEELKKIKFCNKLTNYIEIIDLNNYDCNDKFIFILGFNQKYIPNIFKDEDYFSDNIKLLLDIDTSYDMNFLIRNFYINKIKGIKNLIITYDNKVFISSLNNELNYEIIKIKNNFNNSNLMNKFKLCKMLDNYYKYGYIDYNLDYLYYNYKDILYKKYNNNYNIISSDKLYKYLNNKLTLSYSSIDNYMKCGFKYYLSNILKINKNDNKFSIFIGNLFHYILSICFSDNFDFNKEYENYIISSGYTFSNKEKYFLNNLKNNLLNIIDTIKIQHSELNFKKLLLEEKIFIDLKSINDVVVSFMGIIDKILYDNNSIAIIDYKTGNVDINLDYLEYGKNMQLPIYIYLVNRCDKFKDNVVVGFYLQRILSDDLKLIGYSNEDENLLESFDSNYKNSSIIKGLKITSNGFSTYSKLFDSSKLNFVDSVIEKNIDDSKVGILNSNFNINPKRINNENISCKFCKFKDICYVKEENIINIDNYD